MLANVNNTKIGACQKPKHSATETEHCIAKSKNIATAASHQRAYAGQCNYVCHIRKDKKAEIRTA
jgi:hypothetical protein